jgi:hypothetical protein
MRILLEGVKDVFVTALANLGTDIFGSCPRRLAR